MHFLAVPAARSVTSGAVKVLAEWSAAIELVGIEACPLSEWLHRGLREAGIRVVCIETRQAQRFLSDADDARRLAQLVASQLQIEGTIRGLLRVYGLKIGGHSPQSLRCACDRAAPNRRTAGPVGRHRATGAGA